MSIWDGVRPLRIEVHGQPERQRYWSEVEIGGMHARRTVLESPAVDGLEAMLRKVHDQFVEWEPLVKQQEPEPARWEAVGDPTEWPTHSEAASEPETKPAPRRRGRPARHARDAKPHGHD